MPSSPAQTSHPPRPRLTFRVGVTGHRWGTSLEAGAIPRIEAQLRAVLRRCAQVAQAVQRDHAAAFAAEAPRLVAISSLAEGGDRLFAKEALAAGWRLESVLPFTREEYAKDFEHPAAQAEFEALLARASAVLEVGDPRPAKDSSEAYETAGLVMLDHVDLIIAIWDGGASGGRGGTRETLDEAVRRGMPVVWINTTTVVPTALWDGHTAVPLPELDAEPAAAATRLDEMLAAVLAPPLAGETPEEGGAARRLQRFLRETERQPPWWTAGYDVMLWLTAHRPLRFPVRLQAIASRGTEWGGFIADLPPSGELADEVRDILLPRYVWADHVADRIGRAYRGAYVLNFTLAALSVFVGLLVVFFWDSILIKTICALMEFTLIALILANTHAGARGAWHARFLDARRLAEMLRHARVLAPLGRAAVGADESTQADAGEQWTAWYANATLRELSLPRARADAAYLRAVTEATVKHEVAPQLAYHRGNHHRLNHVHHALDHVGERLFYLTGVLCLVWVAAAIVYETHLLGQGLWIKYGVKPLLTFLGAVLPAIGAALAGIRAQGDFEASAKRSLSTERELEALSERLHHPPAAFREACLLQNWVADAMASDLGSWRSLYANRPLTIPG